MKLLEKLYSIHSGSRREKPMVEFICKWIKRNVKSASVKVDRMGNIYVTKGVSESYPVLASHTDQVQQVYPKDYMVLNDGVTIHAIDKLTRKACGLGADDKNGIWISLKCLQKYPVMKCVFFVSEEVGCVGSQQADMTFFDDARWVAQIDRKGHQDFVNRISYVELCSKKFIKDCNLKSHKRACQDGGMTDVLTLKRKGLKVSCCNMSCGYYEPHTSSEFTVIPDLMNTLALIEHMVEKMTDVYAHEYKVEAPRTYDYSGCGISRWHPYGTRTVAQQQKSVADRITDDFLANYDSSSVGLFTPEFIHDKANTYFNRFGWSAENVPWSYYKNIIENLVATMEEQAEEEERIANEWNDRINADGEEEEFIDLSQKNIQDMTDDEIAEYVDKMQARIDEKVKEIEAVPA